MMRKFSWLAVLLLFYMGNLFAQHKGAILLKQAKFTTGDDAHWSAPSFNDQSWKEIQPGKVWQAQGFRDYHGYAWYRMHVLIPSSLKANAHWQDSLRVFMANVNDVDETFLNGVRIGKIGSFPSDPEGYQSKWPFVREYHIASTHPAIHWDQENVIAVKVYDGGGSGGIFMGTPYIDVLEKIDGLKIQLSTDRILFKGKTADAFIDLENKFKTSIQGTLNYQVLNAATQQVILKKELPISLGALQKRTLDIQLPHQEGLQLSYSFQETSSALMVANQIWVPYLQTPPVSNQPAIHSASAYGARPGASFLFKIAATGKKPLRYQAELPKGLQISPNTGIITGTTPKAGSYAVKIQVSNALGSTEQLFRLEAGSKLALTPPMGWNSWNCWGLSVSDEKVRNSAQALLDRGLADYGWTYMNIDDGWEAASRNADGTISPNDKFPDMKGLSDWLHERGLKLGIYSSPGPTTCGGYLGSYQHEAQDAASYAAWGIDYLKYDWCSYSDIVLQDTSADAYIKPYRLMQQELRKQPRDIYYSLCQYGGHDVGTWGPEVDAQSWRTTGDIEDTWQSLYRIGFSQDKWRPYARPGNWNDPDMMIVGQVGWGENLHPSRLTPDEQYTHVSLWSLLSAPLLIGCDLSKIDDFTMNLLANGEVIAINQDILGKQAKQEVIDEHLQVWVKELHDGSKAIGIFNMDTTYQQVHLPLARIGVSALVSLRDVWRQQDLGQAPNGTLTFNIPPHGVKLIQVKE